MNKLNIVKVYECEYSISLDKEHLSDLSDGIFPVKEIFVFLTDEEKNSLEKANENNFDFPYYDKLLNDSNEQQATEYFFKHTKSIYKDTHIDHITNLDELNTYAEENFLDGYKIDNDTIYFTI